MQEPQESKDINTPGTPDEILIKEALNGNRKAFDLLIKRHQDRIYNICLRMVFNPEEAKDATQEILIKIITKLATFEGRSAFTTWTYRIAVNHLLNMKKSMGEKMHASTFEEYGKIIDGVPDAELPDQSNYTVDMKILVQEVMVSCMFGMLLCLDREQRMVYILGSIFELSDRTGSEILEISRDNFRQKLSRARKDLHSFMDNKCGLVNENNPCRCNKKTKVLLDVGYVDPKSLKFNINYYHTVEQEVSSRLDKLDDFLEKKCNAFFKEHPFQQSPDFVEHFNNLFNDKEFKGIFNLN